MAQIFQERDKSSRSAYHTPCENAIGDLGSCRIDLHCSTRACRPSIASKHRQPCEENQVLDYHIPWADKMCMPTKCGWATSWTLWNLSSVLHGCKYFELFRAQGSDSNCMAATCHISLISPSNANHIAPVRPQFWAWACSCQALSLTPGGINCFTVKDGCKDLICIEDESAARSIWGHSSVCGTQVGSHHNALALKRDAHIACPTVLT